MIILLKEQFLIRENKRGRCCCGVFLALAWKRVVGHAEEKDGGIRTKAVAKSV